MTDENPENNLDTPVDHNFHQVASKKNKQWEVTLSSDYWDYRQKWENYPKKRILHTFPINLDLEATSTCNIKCIMCPRTEMVEKGTFWKNQLFDFEKYKKIIDEGVKNGLYALKYNYLGEPTIHPKLADMIKYAKQAGIIDVMFNTNATKLTEKLSRQLIEAGLDKLFFSFDSPYREQFNRIRVGADYDQVLTNIKNFMKIRNEMGSAKPFTRVSIVIMKDNQDEWEDFKKLFEPIVDAVAYDDYLDHEGQDNPEFTMVPLGNQEKKFCCPQLWQRMFVHPDGVATVCCIDSMRTLQVGNVFEQSIKDIWHGKKYQRLRKLHETGRFDEIPTCARCPLAQYKDE